MNETDKAKYLRQADSLKNGTARQMEIAFSIATLINTVERLTAECDGLRTDLAAARAQTDAIADEWQRENDKLNACRAERDARGTR